MATEERVGDAALSDLKQKGENVAGDLCIKRVWGDDEGEVKAADEQKRPIIKSTERSELLCVCRHCPEHAYVQITIPANIGHVDGIEVEIRSHDQGWADDPGAGSGSYFHMIVVGPDGHEKTRWLVCFNRAANPEPYTQTFTWPGSKSCIGLTSAMVRSLQPLDTLQLVPGTTWIGWQNWVCHVSMTVTATQGSTSSLQHDAINSDHHTNVCAAQILYQPLNLQRKEFRLLKVLPGESGSVVKGILENAYLSEAHAPYEALSYCWGDARSRQKIEISGQIWSIADNLHDALLRLRKTDRARTLWIDAICINQLDLIERANQVQEMRNIFSAATQVNVWLGEQDKMQLPWFAADIEWIREFFNRDTSLTTKDLEATTGAESMTNQDLATWEAQDGHGGCTKFYHVLEVPWFNRVWVLQEVYHAKRILIHCGDQLKGESMSAYLRSISPLYAKMFTVTSPAAGAASYFGYGRRQPDIDVLDIMIAGLDLDATDPRDKLYALLPFTSEMATPALRADYSKDEALVYRDFTRWWIMTRKSLRILSTVHCSLGRTWQRWQPGLPDVRSDLLPTWSFWHTGKSCFTLTTLGYSETTTYRASGETLLDVQLVATGNPATLKLRGVVLGKIQAITHFPYFRAIWQDPPDDSLQEFLDVYERIFDINNARGIYSFGSQARDEARYAAQQNDVAMDAANAAHFRAHRAHAERTGGAIQCHAESFATMTDGSKALCPQTAKLGDIAVVLHGGNVPYLLREKDPQSRSGVQGTDCSSPTYTFVGECYLPGYMQGEALEDATLERRVFEIV